MNESNISYNPKDIEKKWWDFWTAHDLFHADLDE